MWKQLAILIAGASGCSATSAIDETSSSRTHETIAAGTASPSSAVTTTASASSRAPAGASPGATGVRVLARRAPLATYGEVGVTAAFADGDGILALGWYRGVGKGTLPGAIGFDMFAARFDAAGKETLTQNLGGAIVVDAVKRGDDVYVAGEVLGMFTIGNVGEKPLGSIDPKVLTSIVAHYDTQANGRWLAEVDTKDVEHARAVAVGPSRNVLLAGQFFGNTRPGPNALVSKGGADGFVFEVSGAGKPLARTGFGTKADDDVLGLAVGTDGAAYVVGVSNTFAGISYAGGGGFDVQKPPSAFVVKIDSGTKVAWQKDIGGDVSAGATAIAAHPDGGVIVGGFTSGAIPALGIDPKGAPHAMFVVRFSPAGVASEARVFPVPDGCVMPREKTTYPRFLPALRAGGIEAQFFAVTGSPFAPTDLAVNGDGVIGVVGVDTCGGPSPRGPRDGFVALIDARGKMTRAPAKAPRSIEALAEGKWLVADEREVVTYGP